MKKEKVKNLPVAQSKTVSPVISTDQLLGDIRTLIEKARERVAQAVNAGLVMLYWNIGKRIRQDLIGERRAQYGKEIVLTLSRQLTLQYERGFSRANLFSMIRFAEVFTDPKIVQTLSGQLGWSLRKFGDCLPNA